MKSLIFTIFFLTFSIVINSQEQMLSVKEKSSLLKLSPKLSTYNYSNVTFNSDLKDVLMFDKKRRQNKTWAYIFTGLGIVYGGLSIGLLSKNSSISDVLGTITATGSVLSFGASIPFYIGNSKNKKKKREKLIFINNELDKIR